MASCSVKTPRLPALLTLQLLLQMLLLKAAEGSPCRVSIDYLFIFLCIKSTEVKSHLLLVTQILSQKVVGFLIGFKVHQLKHTA